MLFGIAVGAKSRDAVADTETERHLDVVRFLFFPLLVQTLLASVPAPAAVAARHPIDATTGIVTTGPALPSAAERLGLKDDEAPQPEYAAPRPDDEPGELRDDGSFTLPANYAENTAAKVERRSEQKPYKEEKKNAKRGAGGTAALRLDVSGDITANTTWTVANSPYVVSGTMNVQSPATLTIEPGVIVKFDTGGSLLAQAGATLTANGTAANPIIFTSYKDDGAGGDDNGDATETTPAPGDWAALGYAGYHDISGGHAAFGSMTFAEVRYGQQLQARFSKPTIADTKVSKMSLYGLNLDTPASGTYTIQRLTLTDNAYNLYLWAVPSSTEIKDSIIRRATGNVAAVQASSNTAAKLTGNAIDWNTGIPWAIQASSSPMVLRYNSIAFNRRADGISMGINASGSTVDAQYNWWGSTSGPEVTNQATTGGGSRISATAVTYTNWLGSAFEVDHKRGNFPWMAKAGSGIDVASGNFFYSDTDVSIPTIGFPLEIKRTYNSQAATVAGGDFGAGWTWTFGTNLNTAPDAFGGVVWEQADGAKNYFKKNADNGFTGEDGIFSTLVYDPTALQYTLTHKDQTRFVFNSTGKLIKQIDTDGNETVIARDGTGKIQTITEPAGRQLTVTYTGSNISRIVDPLGRSFEYTFASSPLALHTVTRKVAVGGATYASCSYPYTSFPYQLTTVNECNGDKLVLTYDASKRVTTQRLNDNVIQRFTYGPGTDAPSGLTFATGSTGVADQRGRMHVYFYNTKSNKVSEHWHEQATDGTNYWWYSADLWSYVGYLQNSHRDIDQKTTTYTWDQRGNLLEEVKPGSRKTTNTYDASNNRTSTKDNLNRTTSFEYDSEQHLTKVTDPLTRETTMTYTAAGLPATVTDARGKVTMFAYDGWGYPETVTNADSETLTFDYDAGGRKLWEETPQAKRTTYTYSSRSQVLTVTDPLSNVTTTTYDAKGRRETVTDAENHTTTFTYNTTRNVLWKVTDAKNGVIEFTYDNLGPSLTQVKDASGHLTTFTYDLMFGRKATEKDALNNTLTWTYKPSGLLASFKDALNRTTTYTYSTANDLSTISYPDSTSVTQTFDGVGNRLTMTDWLGTHTSTYDALNRVMTATDASSNVVSYTYDEVGNVATITYPGSKTVTYAYDDANRIASVTDWDSRVTAYAYDASGRIGGFALPNGVVTTYGYDDASRTTSVTHVKDATTIAARSYSFDDVGNRVTASRGASSDGYIYDELYRITGITYADGGAQSFVYDATGNRSAETRDGITKTYAYDSVDQLMNAGDGVRTYNANGELTKVGSHLGFTFDVRGKLTQVTTTPANIAPTGSAGADKTVYVNQLVILDGRSSSDPEGEPLTYTWTEGGSNPQTGILRGAVSPLPGFTAATAGTYTFSLTVSDGRATSAADSATITVLAGIPTAQTLTSVTTGATSGYVANTTRTFSQDLMVGKNGPGNTYTGIVQFALPAVPAGTSLTGASLTLMGKSNTGNVAGDLWSVDLLPTNLDANWTVTSTGADVTGATADSTLSPELAGLNQVVLNSPDTWTFSSGELAILASRLTGSGKLSIRARGNAASTSSRINWYGGNAIATTNRPTLSLTFSATPQYDHAPIARAGLDQTVTPGTVTLDGSGSYDYEDAGVTHGWTQLGGSSVTLSSNTAAAPTFTGTPGTYTFRDTVTDSASQTAADEVTITVLPQAVPATSTYAYNGDGDRVSQTAGGTTTSYVMNSVPKNAQVLVETTGGSATYYVYGHDLIYSVKVDGMHAHHTDSLGSTIAVTDAAGAVEQTMEYDVFGRMRSMTGTNGTTLAFAGEENDATALVYLRARYYDPAVGRFLSRDPFAADPLDTQTLNRYAYVKNNPTNYVDPSGEFWDYLPDALFVAADLVQLAAYLTVPGAPLDEPLTNLSADAGSFLIPFVPAGTSRAIRLTEKVAQESAEHTVYRALGKEGVEYVGRTNNFERRAAEHGSRFSGPIEPVAKGLTKPQARGVEQVLIERHGLTKLGGTLQNRINSLAKSNPTYRALTDLGRKLLGW